MPKDLTVSVCIIGGGIAGLYCAYQLLPLLRGGPAASMVLLEKERRLGGRAATGMFEGQRFPKGAGVGRYDKDVLLRQLMRDMDMPVHVQSSDIGYFLLQRQTTRAFIERCLRRLHSQRDTLNRSEETFKAYGNRILGRNAYRSFVDVTGFSDYEQSDVVDALDNYGFEDTYGVQRIFRCDWSRLISRLHRAITKLAAAKKCSFQVRKGACADRVLRGGKVVLADGSIIHATKGVFVACTSTVTAHIFRQYPDFARKITSQIRPQPFLRAYGKVTGVSLSGYTVVPDSEFKKIIPLMPSRGLYMIGYTDNDAAINLHRIGNDADKWTEALQASIPGIAVERAKAYYWETGTHCYMPLQRIYSSREDFISQVQHPFENVWIIGESIALKQGWVEGALQSVRRILYFLNLL